jgi:hypothetical protein
LPGGVRDAARASSTELRRQAVDGGVETGMRLAPVDRPREVLAELIEAF